MKLRYVIWLLVIVFGAYVLWFDISSKSGNAQCTRADATTASAGHRRTGRPSPMTPDAMKPVARWSVQTHCGDRGGKFASLLLDGKEVIDGESVGETDMNMLATLLNQRDESLAALQAQLDAEPAKVERLRGAVTGHIADLRRLAGVFRAYEGFAATASQCDLAADELDTILKETGHD